MRSLITLIIFVTSLSQGIVLLGEHHENSAHHRWQLDVLRAMYSKQPNMAIGLEMFPQYLQNVVDQWVAKTIDRGRVKLCLLR